MKRTWKLWLAGILAVLMLVPVTAWAAETEDRYQEKAQSMIDNYGVYSLQYALMDNGEIVLSGVVGEDGLDQNTVYNIASVSKAFTTTIIMKLVDEGRILLDAPVTAYIPEFTMADERYDAMTVRMLLNHSSGLMGMTIPNMYLWDDNDTRNHDTFLEMLSVQRLQADPGAYSVYCNDGFTLAEIVAERVTEKDFTTLLHEYVTDPLGLEHTVTPQDDRSELSFAPHYLDGVRMPTETANMIGPGGMSSTAEDLVTFGQIYTGEVQILSDASRKATMEKEYLRGRWMEDAQHNIFAYGLGWDTVELYPFDLYGITALSKGGDTQLYHASLIVLPEYNMSAAVVSSESNNSFNQIFATQMLLDRLLESGAITELIELPDTLYTEADYKALDFDPAPYSGDYSEANYRIYHVAFDENGVMTVIYTTQPWLGQENFYYVGDNKFVNEAGATVFSFETYQDSVYLTQDKIFDYPGIGRTRAAYYIGQQVPDNPLEDSVAQAWQERDGNRYWLVNEKHSSQRYILWAGFSTIVLDETRPGYQRTAKIEDENTARGWVTIPMSTGRDMEDFVFVQEAGVEYLYTAGFVKMSEADMETLYSGNASRSTIGDNGYTRWYHIGEEHDGKTITVSCPDTGGFILYDAERNFVTQSAITGSDTATLPAGGLIGFGGEIGDVFDISIAST